jgi:hypothetical protein
MDPTVPSPLTARFILLAQQPATPGPLDPMVDSIMARAHQRGRAVHQYLAERTWVGSRQLYR